MKFSLSRLLENFRWMGHNVIDKRFNATGLVSDVALDMARDAKSAAADVKRRLDIDDALKRRPFELPGQRAAKRRQDLAIADVPRLRAELDALRSATHANDTHVPARVASLEKMCARVSDNLDQLVARVASLGSQMQGMQALTNAHHERLNRVVSDAAMASRAAVRDALDELDTDPSVVSAAFANAERFTEVLAATIDRG